MIHLMAEGHDAPEEDPMCGEAWFLLQAAVTRVLTGGLARIPGTATAFTDIGFADSSIRRLEPHVKEDAKEGSRRNRRKLACTILGGIALHGDGEPVETLMRLGACEALLAAVHTGPFCMLHDVETATEALRAPASLAAWPAPRAKLLGFPLPASAVGVGVVQVCFEKATAAQRPALCAAGCGLLRNLADSGVPAHRRSVMGAAPDQVVLLTLRNRCTIEDPDAALAACELLVALARDKGHCPALLRANVGLHAIKAMRQHKGNALIAMAAAATMLKLAECLASMAAADADADADADLDQHLKILEQSVAAALTAHGALTADADADVSIAKSALATAQQLAKARAAGGKPLPEVLLDAVRATMAAHVHRDGSGDRSSVAALATLAGGAAGAAAGGAGGAAASGTGALGGSPALADATATAVVALCRSVLGL